MKGLIIVMVLTTVGTPVVADDTIHTSPAGIPDVIDMPDGRSIEHDGTTYMAFTLDEYKLLGHIYIDYRSLYKQHLLFDTKLRLSNEIKEAQELRLEVCKNSISTLQADRKYLSARVDEEQKFRLNLDKNSKIEKGLLWALVVVEAVALGVVGVWGLTQASD